MIFVTLESSGILTSVGFMNLDGKKVIYNIGNSNNDSLDIIKMIKKYPILCGYNLKKLDSIILSYIINNYGASASDIFEFSEAIKKSVREHTYSLNDDYKNYRSKFNHYGIIDLQKVNDIQSSDILKTAISIGFSNVSSLNIYKNNHSEKFAYRLNEFISRKLDILKEIYNKSIEKLSARRYLSEQFGEDFLYNTTSLVSSSIIHKKYIAKTGVRIFDIITKIPEYHSIRIADILPDIKFHNQSMIDLYEKLKTITISKYNKDIEEPVITKSVSHKFKRGGLHSVMNPCVIDDTDCKLIYLDFNTFYGELMIRDRIKPVQVNDRFFDVIRDIIDMRDRFKGKDKYVESVIKRSISSISGNLSSKKSLFRDFKAANQLYMHGQLTLLKIIDLVELVNGVECIYSNTDGIILKATESSLKELKSTLNDIKEDIGIPWKTLLVKKLIYLNVNNYVIVYDDKIEGIGIFGDKNGIDDSLYPKVIKDSIINYFLYDKPIKDTVDEYSKDIKNFLYSSSLDSKYVVKYENKYNDIELNVNNRYYVSKSFGNIIYKEAKSKTWNPLIEGYHCKVLDIIEDVDYNDINLNYYISEANSIINKINTTQLKLF